MRRASDDTILRQDETTVLTIFYSPPMDQTGVLIGQVLIESNDSLAPQYQIEMRGQVCTRTFEGSVWTDVEMDRRSGEACDDGNINDDDECRNDCTQAICGDGLIRDGSKNVTMAMRIIPMAACRRAGSPCGDGYVQADSDEECDDGNDNESDGCLNDYTVARCGDGVAGRGRDQDDGNLSDTDGCPVIVSLPDAGMAS